MAKMGEFLVSFQDLQTEASVELQNVQLRNVMTFDIETRELTTPKGIRYYRQPDKDEYPLDLAKGHENMIFSDHDPMHYVKDKCIHFIMKQKLKPDFNFCTTRSAMRQMDTKPNANLVAVKFMDCIYLKAIVHNQGTDFKQFKLRQYLFVDAPGGTPNTDEPVDQRSQIYGIFSATLGKHKLLYSAEMNGVDNSEPLGELDDPEVLKQIRFSMVKTEIKKFESYDWRKSYKAKENIFQAQLAGIEQLRVAIPDSCNKVNEPIKTYSTAELLETQASTLKARWQLLNNILDAISNVMVEEDSPYTAYEFNIKNNCIRYKRHVGPNEHSLDKEYIDFINDKVN